MIKVADIPLILAFKFREELIDQHLDFLLACFRDPNLNWQPLIVESMQQTGSDSVHQEIDWDDVRSWTQAGGADPALVDEIRGAAEGMKSGET
ncbi:MAG: hypothetical protein MUO51_00735 [Woeseiaceae bacterium]|nr:hypothetical protein [Woeseiaceae bacterium]